MHPRTAIFVFCTGLAACASSLLNAAELDPDEQAQAIRQLLTQSAGTAVNHLGRHDGFWGNPRVRIALPAALRRAEKTLRRFGLERYAEEFAETLNHAAEAAMPVAKPLFLSAIQDLVLRDVVEILYGDDDTATRYFRTHSESVLQSRLRPIAAEATAQAGVSAQYKRLLKKATFLDKGTEPKDLDLDDYVTTAALDGLFLEMAEEERRVRRTPSARRTELLQKVFR